MTQVADSQTEDKDGEESEEEILFHVCVARHEMRTVNKVSDRASVGHCQTRKHRLN